MEQEIKVIYENKDFIAVNKPAGVLVHHVRIKALKNEDLSQKTVVNWALRYSPEIKDVGDEPTARPGIVHRLDKETSGVLIIAKNQHFFEHLKRLFQEHKVQKTYKALVWGRISDKGVIDKPIGLKSGTKKHSKIARNMKMVKLAITEYIQLSYIEKQGQIFTLVRLFPKPGRTHQLRVHMASIGHPVVGDVLYGKRKDPWNLERHFLHAESIEFNNADGERIKIEADLPEELQTIILEN